MALPSASHAPSWPVQSRWLWLLPRLAFMLFVASVVAQLWLSERAETEEARGTLISDMLWLEQTLNFNLIHNEELLAEIVPAPDQFSAHAKALLSNGSGLAHIAWLTPDGRLGHAWPGPAPHIDSQASDHARRLEKPAYSPAYQEQGAWRFQVQVPVIRHGRLQGFAVGVYTIDRVLAEAAPWWLAQRYQMGVDDLSGRPLARRSRGDGRVAGSGHRIAFDPPGHGMVLWAAPIRVLPPLSGKLLSASLVFLAILVLWSLWALRRHMNQHLEVERKLREEHAFRKAMEDSLQTGLRARDLHGRITYVNPAFCRMVGWPAEELVGRSPPMPYWADEALDAAREINERILAGHGPDSGYEILLKRRDGETFPALVHTAPLIDAQGQQTGWMSSIVDISRQKQAEELARQQQERLQATARLVSMGEMASSLAHELNQPLAAIASYAAGCINLIDAGGGESRDLREALVKAREQAQRAGRVVRRIYEFVRRAEARSEPFDPAMLIDEVADLVEVDARRQKLRLQRDVAPGLPIIQGDRVLLGQALLNLLRNGIDAMRGLPPAERSLSVTARRHGEWLEIRIADQGGGIPADLAQHLFEPFFTTKPEGMGMGLNICRSIIEAHRGRLSFEPNAGGGSLFIVALPIAAGA